MFWGKNKFWKNPQVVGTTGRVNGGFGVRRCHPNRGVSCVSSCFRRHAEIFLKNWCQTFGNNSPAGGGDWHGVVNRYSTYMFLPESICEMFLVGTVNFTVYQVCLFVYSHHLVLLRLASSCCQASKAMLWSAMAPDENVVGIPSFLAKLCPVASCSPSLAALLLLRR